MLWPELTVSELSSALKRTVEDAFGYVRVRGEITGFRGPHSSGHSYFALKDASAKIEAVIWKGVYGRDAHQAAGRAGGRRHRQADDLSGLVEIPDRHRVAGARRRRRADGAAGRAQEAARRGGPVRPGAQAAAALPAGDRSASSPRRPAPSSATFCIGWPDRFPRRVLVWPVQRAGRRRGRTDRRRHSRLQRAAGARRRCRARTC